MLRRLLARLARTGAPSDDDIARELRDHLELDAESRRSSDSDARRRFGNVTSTYEATRAVWRWAFLEQLQQDVRHGFRTLRRAPVYAVAVVATLGIGVGATAAVFSLSRAIHNPFPRLPQDELLWIMPSNAACGVDCIEVSPAGFLAVQSRAPSLRAVAVSSWATALRSTGGSEHLAGFRVTPATFETIGAPFALGHGFPEGAGRPNGPRFLVLSYDFWHSRFNGSRGVIDSVITVGGFPYTVTGVLDKDVVFPMVADVYAPLTLAAADASDYTSRYLYVFGRLGPAATRSSAMSEVHTIGDQLARESPRTDSGWVLRARPIADFHTDDVVLIEQIAALASLLVFVAACMSAANLSLSRLTTRRPELALRAALGVGRWRLARHLLTEALLISVFASVVGIALAFWGVREIRGAIPADFAAFVPGWARLDVDGATLVFALATATLAMLTFAALPVLRATRVDLAGVLSDGGRAITSGVRGTRSRAALIVFEVSIALVLLTAAMLFTQSVRNMLIGDAGVRLDHTLVMHLTLPATSDSSAAAFYRVLDARLAETSGIRAAGVTTTTPLSNNFQGVSFRLPGRTLGINGREPNAIDQRVTPDYFQAAGIRVEQGRMIGPDDDLRPGAARVVVINRFMADALWPHETPIGRAVILQNVQYTVVGVASNVHHGGLDEALRYTIYRSIAQAPVSYSDLAVWTSGDPDGMRDTVRGIVARVDPNVAVGGMMTMVAMQARHVSAFSMMAGMLEVLAVVATTIATVGLYGLIAYGVAQRTREIGVRIALGAQRRDILSQVGGRAVRLTMIGVVCGVGGAVLFARMLTSLLYGVRASDPRTYVLVSAGLLAVALAAALIPSWRASRVDPTTALRD